MNYFVYIWNTPEGIPYYVGEGQGRRSFVARGIPRPQSKDLIQMFSCESKDECWAYEEYLISFFGRQVDGGLLLNQSLGGPGSRGVMKSKETRDKISEGKRVAVILISPDGEHFCVQNVSGFAKEKGIDGRGLSLVASGSYTHHRGWRLKGGNETRRRDYSINPVKLISPEGDEYIVENLSEHAKQHGLTVTNLTALIKGKRNHHHGWTIPRD